MKISKMHQKHVNIKTFGSKNPKYQKFHESNLIGRNHPMSAHERKFYRRKIVNNDCMTLSPITGIY